MISYFTKTKGKTNFALCYLADFGKTADNIHITGLILIISKKNSNQLLL